MIDTWNPWWPKSKVEKRFEKSSVVGPSDNRTHVPKKKKVNLGPILKELKVKCKKYKLEEYFKDAKKKTVKELKAECKKQKLAMSGTKYILIKRLLEFERESFEKYFKEAKKKTVKELKAECKKQKLAMSGTKYILIKRLRKFERELSEEYFKEAKKKKDKFKNMTPAQRDWQNSHRVKTSSKQNKDFIL